ncbi:MAG: hypothetical protein KDA47_08505 [Planctomycetales bacterium]|nr:hypothetical protein [Planctomycetales bacterium]
MRAWLFSALVFGVMAADAASGADELFSKVAIDSVYGSDDAASADASSPSVTRRGRAISNMLELSELLTSAGFEPKSVEGGILTIKVERKPWELPVLVMMNSDESQVRMVMMLSVVKDIQSVKAQRMIGLLSANREIENAFFAVSEKRGRVELHRWIDNAAITDSRLRNELNGLAEIAANTEKQWDFSRSESGDKVSAQTKPAAAAGPAENTSTEPAKSVAASDSLVGKWAAARSDKEAFAMQLNADNTFALVTVLNGKTTKSTGKFELTGQTLKLIGNDGTRLTGTVTVTSGSEFRFQFENSSTSLTFKKS